MILATLLTFALTSQAQLAPTHPPAAGGGAQPMGPSMGRPAMPPGARPNGPGPLNSPPGLPPMSPPLTGENAPVERDLMIACAVARMATAMSNAPAYREHKDELNSRARDMAKAAMRSKKGKDTLAKALQAKDMASKQAPWMELARSITLDKWQCPPLGDL